MKSPRRPQGLAFCCETGCGANTGGRESSHSSKKHSLHSWLSRQHRQKVTGLTRGLHRPHTARIHHFCWGVLLESHPSCWICQSWHQIYS